MSAILDYDTGPLNWVRGDIDAALQAALGRVQAYSVDADLTNALRLAGDDAHQVTGALRMVSLEGAATLAATLESCLADIDENRLPPSDELLRALRNAMEGLQRWVKDLADGRGSGELALFPLYKRLRELQGAERVFEGELFFPDLRARAQGKAANDGMSQEELSAAVKVSRALFQRGLLAFLRNVEAEQGLQRMRDSLVAVERIAPSQASQSFWWACLGFVDSLIARGVEADFHVKQLLARVDLQMRRLMEGSPQVAERLMRDALFFVAKSQSLGGRAAEVRSTFGLDRYLPGRGMLDPETLARMRPVLDALQAGLKAARDHWHAFVDGHADHLQQFQSQLTRMQPQAHTLDNSGLGALLEELSAASAFAEKREGEARDQVSLEVASTLLFIQNAVNQEDVLHADFLARAEGQQARLRALIEGRAMPVSAEDSASQRESERDMLVQMAQEVGQNLRQMEEVLDAFFRNSNEREDLATLPALAQQAQGALTMLELPDAASLLAVATEATQPYVSEGEPDDATQQRLADAFSSLGLFIEAYCAGRVDAGRMLRPVLIDFGVVEADEPEEETLDETIESGLPARKAGVKDAYLDWRDQQGEVAKKKYLEVLTELSHDAELIDDSALLQQTRSVLEASRNESDAPYALDADIARLTGCSLPERARVESLIPETSSDDEASDPVVQETNSVAASNDPSLSDNAPDALDVNTPDSVVSESMPMMPETSGADERLIAAQAVPVETAMPEGVLTAIPDDVEMELLEIFLEEANDVLAAMGDASELCQSNPDDAESITVIRRGFHTLKGSGRMVGLADLGETAWRLEQFMNNWLADDKPADSNLIKVIEHARSVFQDWVNALQAGQIIAVPVSALLAAADRVALGQPYDAESDSLAGVVIDNTVQTPASDEIAVREIEDEALLSVVSQDGDNTEFEIAATSLETEAEPIAEVSAVIEWATPAEAVEPAEAEDIAPVLDVGAVIEYAVAPESPLEPEVTDEICIESVCLSRSLYEIFIVEARQRITELQEESERHAETPHSNVSEHARRASHTLAGIAGTAGLSNLTDLSHALEQYWNRFVHAPLPTAHLALVDATIMRLGEMIDTIEGGHLPESADDLIAALGELEDEQTAPAVPVVEPTSETLPEAVDEAMPTAEPVAEEIAEVKLADEPEAAVVAQTPLDVSALVSEIRPVMPAPVFERREVTDEIDEQLLPIFLEEADTLVPDTSAQLRAWKDAPQDLSPRDALRRNLHTIKGSARMVGAMRLGELTHVMESRVIAVIEGHLTAEPGVFDTLETQLDRVADLVERLKRGDLTPIDDDAATPVKAPVEPVLSLLEEAESLRVSTANVAEAPAQTVTRDAAALTLRVRADWVDRMVNQAGEVAIARSRIESEVFAFKRHVNELSEALLRLRGHIREVEIQAESQMQATFQTQGVAEQFDPLEFDRFTRFQEVTRFLAESVNDISTVQHILLARLGETDAALIQQSRLNRELQQNLLRVRMVPLNSVADRLYRTVRQTARDVEKLAQLDIQGGDLEIDRSVLEKVTAPLEHLLRNALAHGVEMPEARRAAGKTEFGEIVLSARQSGNEMMLTVKDDGAGLNYTRIREKAEAAGLLPPGIEPTETLLAQMIFAAGFTTAETVSQVAGRGVGMDVVKSEIAALGGRIDIVSTEGVGTSFHIYLPLTLAMTQAVMVQAAKHDYALPTPLVQQVLELKPAELELAMQAGEVSWRGATYPFSYLPHLLGDAEAVHEVMRYNPVVLLQSGASQAAVLVDNIEGTREIVVKNIGPQMARITGVVGATVRGDGRVILIMNPVPLALRWASQPRAAVEQRAPTETVEISAALQVPMVLVVDDSLTVRKITTRLLTREGFRVDSAKDGVDALEKMNDLIPDVVLLDVEMPRMDGFELARVMRSDARLKSVPIIMITSRTADKHRNHAMEIGVNVYLGKPYQEQQLLDNIAEQLEKSAVEHS
ncbi:MAG TPA: Hpt domain-containing protein [Thiobacillus sp.]